MSSGTEPAVVVAAALSLVACSRGDASESGASHAGDEAIVRLTGSDTMVNLDQAWAENYKKVKPEVSVQIAGGGSGVGIAGLIDGILDIAASQPGDGTGGDRDGRPQSAGSPPRSSWSGWTPWPSTSTTATPSRRSRSRSSPRFTGKAARFYQWSQLGISNPACPSDQIIRVSRQNNSGTYVYFREAVLGDDRGAEAGFDRPERLQGRGGAGVPHAVRHRLQRHGLRQPRGSRAGHLEEEGRGGGDADDRDGPRRHLPAGPAALLLHPRHAHRRRRRSSSTGCSASAGQKILQDIGYVPAPKRRTR